MTTSKAGGEGKLKKCTCMTDARDKFCRECIDSYVSDKTRGLVEALTYIASMERFTFAECVDAENIIGAAKKALEAYK